MRTSTVLAVLIGAFALGTAHAKPSSKRPTDLERGKELYERHCVSCHGATNHGDGPATEALVFDVPDLVGQIDHKKSETQDLVMQGRGAMPSFEASFDSRDARRVLMYMAEAHIKGKEKPAPDEDEEADEDEEPSAGDPTPDEADGQAPDPDAADGQAPE